MRKIGEIHDMMKRMDKRSQKKDLIGQIWKRVKLKKENY